MYRVIKVIGGKRYIYDQRTWRENGKVKTQSIYVGPADGGGSGSLLSRKAKKQEVSFDADLDHAMVMVARLTGKSVDDQLAQMNAEFADRDGRVPTLAAAATFAAPGEQMDAPASEASTEVAQGVGESAGGSESAEDAGDLSGDGASDGQGADGGGGEGSE